MATCLLLNAIPRINQQNRDIGRRGTCRHIPCILDMTRRIRDNKLTFICRKESIGNINGDALLPLGSETVDQKGEIHFIALSTGLLRIFLNAGELIFINEF